MLIIFIWSLFLRLKVLICFEFLMHVQQMRPFLVFILFLPRQSMPACQTYVLPANFEKLMTLFESGPFGYENWERGYGDVPCSYCSVCAWVLFGKGWTRWFVSCLGFSSFSRGAWLLLWKRHLRDRPHFWFELGLDASKRGMEFSLGFFGVKSVQNA